MTEEQKVLIPAEKELSRTPSVEDLMQIAIEQDRVEQLERLMVLRDKVKKEQAKESFYKALAAFQAECPPILKERRADKWGYADLADILKVAGPLLKTHGFSWHISSPYDKETNCVQGVCEVHHIDGHDYKPEPVSMPLDPDHYGNKSQQAGSAITYAKRYAFVNAFGILTADPDDDGRSSGEAVNSPANLYGRFRQLMAATLRNAESILTVKAHVKSGDIQAAVQAMHEIEDEDRLALWVSPAKGGVWSTEERTLMRGEDWASIWKQMT